MEDGLRFIKKSGIWIISILFVLLIGQFVLNKLIETTKVNDSVIIYEEFQEIYNTCSKLNTDLCNIKSLNEKDIMFEQFSKSQRILAIKTQLNRWVEEYNAKSKMFGRSLWKSSELPYQLDVNQFKCNN